MATIELKVDGMTCGGCVKGIQSASNARDGVNNATADLEGATVTGEFEDCVIQQAAIKDAIEAAGFDVTA